MLSNVTAAQSVNARFVPTLNVDGSSTATLYHGPTDGQIIVALHGAACERRAGPRIWRSAVRQLPTRWRWRPISPRWARLLDIDGNASIDPATDGLLIVRWHARAARQCADRRCAGPAPERGPPRWTPRRLAGLMP